MKAHTLNAVWDDRPAEFAAKRDCWLTRRRIRYVLDFLRKASPGENVLDLGCGVGDLAIALARARPTLNFTGVEPQQSYVDFARDSASRERLQNISFWTGSAEELTSPASSDRRFDWILSNDLLHHVSSYTAVFQAVARVAHAGSQWLAIEPNCRNPYVFLGALLRPGERNFWPRQFLREGRSQGWFCRNKAFLFLVPPFIRDAPPFLVLLESKLEHNPLLAGGVALTLTRRSPRENAGESPTRRRSSADTEI